MSSQAASCEELIAFLVAAEPGYHVVALGERLSVFQLCCNNDGKQFVVSLDDEDGKEIDERNFATATEAASFFETQRKRIKMGFEFEKIPKLV